MKYSLEILKKAQKQLSKIDKNERARIVASIKQLAENPRPSGCTKLSGREAWRIRMGSYRIIYEIHDNLLLVLVVITIGHRREVYR